jgi:hypothetical protein
MAYVKIIDDAPFRSRFKTVDYPITRINYKAPFGVKVKQDLPFRVRFTTITVPGYGPFNVPPIGIAVIGFNNYIL